MPLDPGRQLKAVERLLERLHDRHFYGEVIIRMEAGNVLYSRIQEIRQIQDLVAEAEKTPDHP